MSHSMGTSDMSQLVGGRITAIIADATGQAHGFRVLVEKVGMSFDCFVQSDDEGNDIGSVVVVPAKLEEVTKEEPIQEKTPNYTVWRDGELIGAHFYTIQNAKQWARDIISSDLHGDSKSTVEVRDHEANILFTCKMRDFRMKWEKR